MKYFKSTNIEDLKQEYKKRVKELHPDNGGDEEEFKKMQAEFAIMYDRLKNIHKASDGTEYEKDNKSTETAQQFMDIIEKLNNFVDCKIEIMGSWIWVSGNTMVYHDELKEIGFFWSKSKKAWYYTGGVKKHRRGNFTMKELRKYWDSKEVKAPESTKLLGSEREAG